MHVGGGISLGDRGQIVIDCYFGGPQWTMHRGIHIIISSLPLNLDWPMTCFNRQNMVEMTLSAPGLNLKKAWQLPHLPFGGSQPPCLEIQLCNSVVLMHSQKCATFTTVNFRTFSSPQKEALYPLPIIFLSFLPLHSQF